MPIDDPRGHDDGDIAIGSADERRNALYVMFRVFVLSIADEGVYSSVDLIDACNQMVRELRRPRLKEQAP